MSLRAELEGVLSRVGLDAGAVALFADAVLLAGAVSVGRPVSGVGTGFVPSSRPAAPEGITRQDDETDQPGEEGSVGAHCAVAERALVAVEAVNQVISRLERVRLVAVGEGVVAMGRAELARRGARDPGELAPSVRERWRWRSKSRVRQDLAPATGWTRAETASVVAVACAPVAFRAPVFSALSRGTVTWLMVRGLWRACDRAGLSAADAAHVAHVLLADDPGSCVPERLAPDGTVVTGPWGQGAFWGAVDREVAKVTACPDPGDEASVQAAQEAREARQAAFRARSMWVRVNEDGTAQVTLTGTSLKVVALRDRLQAAARAARGAGDPRTVTQLATDIGIALLGHATIGTHDLPDLGMSPAGQDSPVLSPEDLAAAGWTPQVIAALSSLPPATLQVVVPLLALHDPAAAHTLPGVARTATTLDPNHDPAHDSSHDSAGDEAGQGTAGAGQTGQESEERTEQTGHTGRPGCPACLPTVRAARHRAIDHATRREAEETCAHDPDPGKESVHDPEPGVESVHGPDVDPGLEVESVPAQAGGPRVAWVGRVLGKDPQFVGPDLVRRLALSPGTTLVRLLVDPADGRCLERSSGSYSFDAAMRAQLAAADVSCRAPGCEHPAAGCQVDHVVEHGIGGATKESNGQLLEPWHHDPKTAKAWDAVLHANRDVTWTTTLSRIYRTRTHDYRELVTVMVDALDRIANVPVGDVADQMNREVYQALCYRGVGERLNEGDDDTYDETHLSRFGGSIDLALSHRDPATGARTPGPSPAAQTRADAAAALARTPGPSGDSRSDDDPGTARGHDDRSTGDLTEGVSGSSTRDQDREAPWSQHRDDEPPPF